MKRLAEQVARSESLLVFTGAGVSTGSGIPDFRGPQGVWKKRDPVYYQDFMTSEASRTEYWDQKLEGFEAFWNAKPNAAHRSLVELERRGKLDCLVTQNIDGLHQLAGNAEERIIELHGSNRLVQCQSCRKTDDPRPAFKVFAETKRCPRCPCGGFLKPATISFGQQMDHEKLQRAFAAATRADLVISAGSTLSVEPAASVPLAAHQNNAPYAILNQGPTEHDRIATLRYEGDVTTLLPELIRELESLLD